MQKGILWKVIGDIVTDFKIEQVSDIFKYMSFQARETYGNFFHDHVEIIYVKKGNCILHIDHESISFKDGEIMIIGAKVNHSLEAGDSGVTTMHLVFHPELFSQMKLDSEELSQQFNSIFEEKTPVIKISNDPHIVHSLQNIISELENKRRFHQHLVLLSYAELYALINRYLYENYLPMCNNESIQKAIVYIHRHYMEDITMTNVAAYCNISERYLRKLFTQYLQVSPLDYLNQFRINKAIDLLKNAEYSIKEVSALCGFQSPQYFSRVFKKQTGSCPRNIVK